MTTLNQKCVPEDILKSDYSLQSGEFTDPGYLQALQIYSDLHQYMNKDVAAYDWSFAYSGLINGDCALVYDQYVTVADSGLGIPEDSIERIFERFYRVDKSHSREIGGTGLGLAITRSSIAMHHGIIKVSSKEGEGTTFTVKIPLSYIPS